MWSFSLENHQWTDPLGFAFQYWQIPRLCRQARRCLLECGVAERKHFLRGRGLSLRTSIKASFFFRYRNFGYVCNWATNPLYIPSVRCVHRVPNTRSHEPELESISLTSIQRWNILEFCFAFMVSRLNPSISNWDALLSSLLIRQYFRCPYKITIPEVYLITNNYRNHSPTTNQP